MGRDCRPVAVSCLLARACTKRPLSHTHGWTRSTPVDLKPNPANVSLMDQLCRSSQLVADELSATMVPIIKETALSRCSSLCSAWCTQVPSCSAVSCFSKNLYLVLLSLSESDDPSTTVCNKAQVPGGQLTYLQRPTKGNILDFGIHRGRRTRSIRFPATPIHGSGKSTWCRVGACVNGLIG